MMEIVVISDVLGEVGGANRATLLLCRALAQLHINVTCFTTWAPAELPLPEDSFRIIRPAISRGSRWNWPDRSLAFQAIHHMKKNRVKVAIVMGVTPLSRLLLTSPVANRLLVWELTNARGSRFVDVRASKLLASSKAVLSPASSIDRSIRDCYGYSGEIWRLPFWVEDTEECLTEAPEQFAADFIFFGRRDEEKGLSELVQATALLVETFPSMKVVIGGAGDASKYAALIAELGVGNNISITQFPSQADVSRAMAQSRCLVLPSYHEGYPLVLIEAARASLPFIATDVGSVREVFGAGKSGVIIKAKSVESLANAMKLILEESLEQHVERRKSAHALFKQISSSESVRKSLEAILQGARSTVVPSDLRN